MSKTALLNPPRKLRLIGGLAAICGLAYLPSWLGLCFGAWPFADDALANTGVWRELTRSALGQGALPLWNPHLFCGMPFMSTGQSGVFYPPNAIYWIIPVRIALLLDAVFHNVLLAYGAYTLARALGLSRLAAWVTTVSFALSTAVSAHVYAGHVNWHAARAYLPWELWALLCYLRSGQPRYAWLLAVVFSFQIASGYPPYVILSMGLCGGLCLAWIVTRLTECRRAGQAKSPLLPCNWPTMLIGAGSLTVLLAAVHILPLRELSRLTVHGAGLPYQYAVVLSGTWRTFVRLIAPGFFGGTGDLQWSTPFDAHEESGYIGLLPLMLALGAPILARGFNHQASSPLHSEAPPLLPRPVPWLWMLLPLSAVLMLGDNTPLYHWLFDHVFVLRMTRIPARWVDVWCLAAAYLAGFSVDGCLKTHASANSVVRTETANPALLEHVLWAVAGFFLVFGCGLFLTSPSTPFWAKPAEAIVRQAPAVDQLTVTGVATQFRLIAFMECLMVCLVAALSACLWRRRRQAITASARQRIAVLLVAFITADLLFSFWRWPRLITAEQARRNLQWPVALTRYYQPEQRWDTSLLWSAVNLGLPAGVDIFNGYDAMSQQRYFQFVAALEGRDFWDGAYQPRHRSPLLQVASVTHTISSTTTPQIVSPPNTAPLKLVAREGAWTLWKHPQPWPRVYLSRRLVRQPDAAQLNALSHLAAQSFATQDYPVVVNPKAFPRMAGKALTAGDKVLRWSRNLNKMQIQTQAGAPSVLVQSEAWYPGWRAWVNGLPVPVEQANFLFRGVAVPAGVSQVRVVYEPATYRFGLFCSLWGLAVLGALAMRLRAGGGREDR